VLLLKGERGRRTRNKKIIAEISGRLCPGEDGIKKKKMSSRSAVRRRPKRNAGGDVGLLDKKKTRGKKKKNIATRGKTSLGGRHSFSSKEEWGRVPMW